MLPINHTIRLCGTGHGVCAARTCRTTPQRMQTATRPFPVLSLRGTVAAASVLRVVCAGVGPLSVQWGARCCMMIPPFFARQL